MDVYEEEVDEVLESDDEEALRGEKGKDAASKVAIKSAIDGQELANNVLKLGWKNWSADRLQPFEGEMHAGLQMRLTRNREMERIFVLEAVPDRRMG
jgi:hypothetical protein